MPSSREIDWASVGKELHQDIPWAAAVIKRSFTVYGENLENYHYSLLEVTRLILMFSEDLWTVYTITMIAAVILLLFLQPTVVSFMEEAIPSSNYRSITLVIVYSSLIFLTCSLLTDDAIPSGIIASKGVKASNITNAKNVKIHPE